MLANMTAYGLAKRLRPTPIYEALLEQDGVVLPHGAPREHALDRLTVRNAMSSGVVSVRVSQTVGDVRALLESKLFTLAPVLDAAGALVGALPLAEARAAARETPIAKLMRRVDTVLDDVSLTRAVVLMNDSAARQLVVLDGKTASQVVGVVSITDLVRAYAKVPPLATLPPPGRAEGLGELRASDLAVATPVVVGSSSVEEFMATLAASPSGAVVVEVAAGAPGIILLEHVRDFLRDDQVQRMLVASDVMRPLPMISPEAGSAEISRLCVTSNASALLLSTGSGERLVLTRTMVGESLLRGLAKHLGG
jgi:CBS domain-containing protein